MRGVKPARAEGSAAKDARREVRAGCHRRRRASHRTGRRKFIPERHVARDRFDTELVSIPRNHFFEEKIRAYPTRDWPPRVSFGGSCAFLRQLGKVLTTKDPKRNPGRKNLKAGPQNDCRADATSGREARGRGGDAHERGPARASAARVAAMDSEEAITRWLEPDESGASGAGTRAPDLNLTLRTRLSRLVVSSPLARIDD